jgi:CYTH domain-containing protein
MKRILTILLTTAVLLTIVSSEMPQPNQQLRGDVDVNGKIELADAVQVIMHVAKLPSIAGLPIIADNPTIPGISAGKAEIERKFLIDLNSNLPWDKMEKGQRYELTQSYISFSPEIRIRQVVYGSLIYWFFAMKQPLDDKGLSRQEIEFEITKDEYEELFKKKSGDTIYKTRYQFYDEGVYCAVDIFHVQLDGHATVEVEFKSEEDAEAFVPLKWFGKDVTSDKAYKNGSLARDGLSNKEIRRFKDTDN